MIAVSTFFVRYLIASHARALSGVFRNAGGGHRHERRAMFIAHLRVGTKRRCLAPLNADLL